MCWVGLERYGYLDEAQRLAYRFLYMSVVFPLLTLCILIKFQDDDGICGL